jgi:hypothetical protein
MGYVVEQSSEEAFTILLCESALATFTPSARFIFRERELGVE